VFCVTVVYLELAVARIQLREVDQRRGPGYLPNINTQDLVVIYNRVPKTGSTSFMGVAYDLCKQNGFHVLHINITGNMHALSLKNQVWLLFIINFCLLCVIFGFGFRGFSQIICWRCSSVSVYIADTHSHSLSKVVIVGGKKRVVGLERSPFSLVSTTEELLDRKVAAPV
jgi:hypothetical protein